MAHTMIGRRALGGLAAGAVAAGTLRGARAQGDALVAAAKAEGEMSFYCAAPEGAPRRAVEGFTKRYGIKAQFVRVSSGPMMQRYSSESEVGHPAADLIMLAGNAIPYGQQGVAKGWFEPVVKADIPAITGEYPAKFLRGDGIGAVVQIAPWVIAYNTDFVKPADVPKDWPDLLNPKFKGNIILADPLASDAFYDEWQAVLSKHGEAWFAGLRAQAPRWRGDGILATTALAAGECWLHFPITPAQQTDVHSKGAPVEIAAFDLTSGVEITMLMTHRTKAKHPNAARLFANYVLTPEGSKLFNDDPGIVGPYSGVLPREYFPPRPLWTQPERDRLRKLLGLS